MRTETRVFVIIFSFLFPLILITWGIKDSFNEIEKKVVYEGRLFNIIFLFAFIFLKYLSLIPFLGVVFSAIFTVTLLLYVLSIIVILGIKIGDIERELPFISFYAEKLKDK